MLIEGEKNMFKLLKLLRRGEIAQIFISLIFIVAQVWLNLKLPHYISEEHIW